MQWYIVNIKIKLLQISNVFEFFGINLRCLQTLGDKKKMNCQ